MNSVESAMALRGLLQGDLDGLTVDRAAADPESHGADE